MIYILNVLYKGRCFRSDRGYNSKKLNKLYLKKYPGKDYLKFDDAVSYLLNGSYISEVKKKDIKYYIIDIKKVSSALDSHGISIAMKCLKYEDICPKCNILNVHDRGVTEYSINPDSPIVKSVDALNNAIIGEMLGEEKLNEISEYISERQNVQNSKSTAFSSGINGSSNTDNSDSNSGYNTGGDDGNNPVPGYCGEEHKYVCHGHKGER